MMNFKKVPFQAFLLCGVIGLIVSSCKKDEEGDDSGEDNTTNVINIPLEIQNQNFAINEASDSTEALAYIVADGDSFMYYLHHQDQDSLFRVSEEGNLFLRDGKSFNMLSAREHLLQIGITDKSDSLFADITINLEYQTSAFVTSWETTSPQESIKFSIAPLVEVYNYSIDWGDGTIDNNVTANITHIYEEAEKYLVRVSGDFHGVKISSGGASNTDKLKTIEHWGAIQWKTMKEAFSGCGELTYAAKDQPDLTMVTDLELMFEDCYVFNGDISNWNTSNITNMTGMFYNCYLFDQNLNNWDVSNVTSTVDLFNGCFVFNGPLDNWIVSNVTNMARMFRNTKNFNQPIGNWNTSSVTRLNGFLKSALAFNQSLDNWDVSNVTHMNETFDNAAAFNQPLNSWDVSSVTNMESMFEDAGKFNQPLANWDVSSVTNMNNMFNNALKYEENLNHWATDNVTQCTWFGTHIPFAKKPIAGPCFN